MVKVIIDLNKAEALLYKAEQNFKGIAKEEKRIKKAISGLRLGVVEVADDVRRTYSL